MTEAAIPNPTWRKLRVGGFTEYRCVNPATGGTVGEVYRTADGRWAWGAYLLDRGVVDAFRQAKALVEDCVKAGTSLPAGRPRWIPATHTRVPINVHPDVRSELAMILCDEPRLRAVGYSEFIHAAIRAFLNGQFTVRDDPEVPYA